MDAYCPHLGAHLGHGGRVEGGAVRCPFHAWLWGGDGRCLEVPYATVVVELDEKTVTSAGFAEGLAGSFQASAWLDIPNMT